MTAPQCAQPATTAGAPPVPVTLRAIAAWLESHPEIEPQYMDLPWSCSDSGAIQQHGLESYEQAAGLMASAGLRWHTRSTSDGRVCLYAEIVPGFNLELFAAIK